jgi:hypothetical protein
MGDEAAASPAVNVGDHRLHGSKGPSLLGRILAAEGVCLWLLCAALVARLMSGLPLAPPFHDLPLHVVLPSPPLLGTCCGAVAVRLGARRWGWIAVTLNAVALLLLAAALAILLYLLSQPRFTLGS